MDRVRWPMITPVGFIWAICHLPSYILTLSSFWIVYMFYILHFTLFVARSFLLSLYIVTLHLHPYYTYPYMYRLGTVKEHSKSPCCDLSIHVSMSLRISKCDASVVSRGMFTVFIFASGQLVRSQSDLFSFIGYRSPEITYP